jgi:hypothetical protein
MCSVMAIFVLAVLLLKKLQMGLFGLESLFCFNQLLCLLPGEFNTHWQENVGSKSSEPTSSERLLCWFLSCLHIAKGCIGNSVKVIIEEGRRVCQEI